MNIEKSSNANMVICRNYLQMLDLEDWIRLGKTPIRQDVEMHELYGLVKNLEDLHFRYWETNRDPKVYLKSDDGMKEIK